MSRELIQKWTMDGAAHDDEGRSRSAAELRDALAPRWSEPAEPAPRMRRADEEDWKPFLTGVEGDGERA